MGRTFFLLGIVLFSCSHKNSNLATGPDNQPAPSLQPPLHATNPNTPLLQYIDSLRKGGMVGESPLLVIDGFQHGTDFLGTHEIPRKSIYVLSFLSKEAAPNIFGNSGKEGVILITSKFGRLSAVLSTRDSKALYIVNGVDTPPPTVKNIPPEQMESIEVIEGNEIARKKYSSEYEVVFIIKLKKP